MFTQEDPWQQFARTHYIGQVVRGRVTEVSESGATVRVEERLEGLIHRSELADQQVEPAAVVAVGAMIIVTIIGIDLDRRRISLSLKKANEGTLCGEAPDEFDPTLYGMPASYDEQGNYELPEGFDPETGEWLPGYEKQGEEWDRQYDEARARFEAHRRQVEESRRAARHRAVTSGSTPGSPATGTLASDPALAALREKLSGGRQSAVGTPAGSDVRTHIPPLGASKSR
jgi:small subunit ribosomal protein S1